MNFDEWYAEIIRIATDRGHPEVISPDKESYREYFDDGDDPESVVSDEFSYCDWEPASEND